ncbi:MAG: type II and III secretion system protein family protein [Bryobacteraceae bacterium]|nr:type II and III secretion system protein family protein [Bryobacteraceae bacterium]
MIRVWSAAISFVLLGASATASAQSAPEELKIPVGRSMVIDYPADVRQISTSNPDVVDAVAVTTREILLHGKGQGSGTVIIWAKTGQRTFYNITVDQNLEPLREMLRDTFPGESIKVQSGKDSLALTGHVSSKEVSDRAAALAAGFSKAVVNNLEIAAVPVEKQVLLRVRFAELNRTAASSLGVNLVSTGAGNTPGQISTGQFASASASTLKGAIPGSAAGTVSEFDISDVLNVFAFRPDLNISAFIKALQTRGLLQILAEPNLVTVNNKEASFLVGGEFPVPVVQGGASMGTVTVQFREFGIRLTFLPSITGNGTIKMHVKPEVSTIDIANSVTLSGFTIPALATRRMETNIELAEGQSFVIGGLIDDRVTESASKIPGLSNIPILGALFKSRQENKSKSELVVMVTPEIVHPLDAKDPKPMPVMPREFMGPATAGDGTTLTILPPDRQKPERK